MTKKINGTLIEEFTIAHSILTPLHAIMWTVISGITKTAFNFKFQAWKNIHSRWIVSESNILRQDLRYASGPNLANVR